MPGSGVRRREWAVRRLNLVWALTNLRLTTMNETQIDCKLNVCPDQMSGLGNGLRGATPPGTLQ